VVVKERGEDKNHTHTHIYNIKSERRAAINEHTPRGRNRGLHELII